MASMHDLREESPGLPHWPTTVTIAFGLASPSLCDPIPTLDRISRIPIHKAERLDGALALGEVFR